jgi:hypothetical protein
MRPKTAKILSPARIRAYLEKWEESKSGPEKHDTIWPTNTDNQESVQSKGNPNLPGTSGFPVLANSGSHSQSPGPIPPIARKRAEIFSPELKDLVERVKSPQNTTTLSQSQERIKSIFHSLIKPEKQEEFRYLQRIYIPERKVQESAIMDYTGFLLERLGIEHFSWHFLSYESQAYFSEMSQGLDIVTRKNFIFLQSDPYIKSPAKHFFELEITLDILSDPFFSKKFSVESISFFARIYFFFLSAPGVDACLVALLNKEVAEKNRNLTGKDELSARWVQMVQDKLPVLVPALTRYRKEKLQPKISEEDMLTKTIHLFKSTIGMGLQKAYVTKVSFLDYKNLENAYFLKRQYMAKVRSLLTREERMIELAPAVILILSRISILDQLRSLATEDNLKINLDEKRYPLDGENIFLYF